MLVLAERCGDLQGDALREIGARLLSGPAKWNSETHDEFEKRRSWWSLNRITWLAENGCPFTFDLEVETRKLRRIAVEWKHEHAARAADSRGIRGGWVQKETQYSSLTHEPLASILSKASALSGSKEDLLVEKDPFAGLAKHSPVLAFRSLTDAAKRNEFPEWAWRTFLSSEARKHDKPKFSALIAERLSRYPDEALGRIVRPVSDWVLSSSKKLALPFPDSFDRIIPKAIRVLSLHRSADASSIIRGGKEPDWAMEAINSTAGKIARALFDDTRLNGLKMGDGIPMEWAKCVNALFSLGGDPRRYVLVICAQNLQWFYDIDQDWTERNLLAPLEGESDQDRSATWSGFLLNAREITEGLCVRMKLQLLDLAKTKSPLRRQYTEVLAGLILSAWGSRNTLTQERFVSNDEMRDLLLHADDDCRCRMLWQMERWSGDNEPVVRERWLQLSIELLGEVWPRQKSVKTPITSTNLCNLAFANVERSPEIIDIVLPLLGTIDRGNLIISRLRDANWKIVALYPKQILTLLYTVLPENGQTWPYGVEEVLRKLLEADSGLSLDERLLELNRKWDAR